MSFLQTMQNPMCIRINHVILLKKMYMYNCIQTNMLEFHPTDFLDQDRDTIEVPYEHYHNVHTLLTICMCQTLLPYLRVICYSIFCKHDIRQCCRKH